MDVTRLPNKPDFWLPESPSKSVTTLSSTTPDSSAGRLAEYRISLASLPYLADHAFHDMVVLPGSFYIELVRQLHRDLFQRDALSLRDIVFESPVILTDDVTLTIRVEQGPDSRVTYTLFESTGEALQQSPGQQPCAHLEVDFESPASSFSQFQPQEPSSTRSAADFYRALRHNGNQYGPNFQVVERAEWFGLERSERTRDSEPEGCERQRASIPLFGGPLDETTRNTEPVPSELLAHLNPATTHLTPTLLDAAPQLLSAFTFTRGQTFILKSIAHLQIVSTSGPTPWRARATTSDPSAQSDSSDSPSLTGTVQILDAEGHILCHLTGVTLAFIDRPAATAPAPESTPLVVASTFTAEPLEDSLKFWGTHFNRPVKVEFAPYNQVFQQFLDPASAFHQNRTGVNLLTIAVEDWWQSSHHTLQSVDPARAATHFGPRQRTTLPNGLEIAHLNRYETDYVYQEIFQDESYLRHGIQLADDDTVIDIGANIGLFSLFVMSRCKKPSIYAFEPSPRVFDLLQANCAAYGDPSRVRAFNRGVSEKTGTAQFTFYEHSSVFSSFHPDEHEDRAAVEAVVRNVMENELGDASQVNEGDVEQLTSHRLRAQTIDCPLTSVSDIIRENGLRKINLLKIDAEKSEIEILRGIAEEHWPLIEQIVMEIHDRSRAAVQSIEDQLTQRGFRCAVVEEKLLEDSGLFNIYARRIPMEGVPEGRELVAGGEAKRNHRINLQNESRPEGGESTVQTVPAENPESALTQKVEEFCTALDSFAAATSAPLILAITPRVSGSPSALNAAEQQILSRAARHSRVHTISSQSILDRYPVRQLHDEHSHKLGHMPFTAEGYAALGTALSRAIFSLDAPPVKVIVLDCDNTLWQGLAAEDGPNGVTVPPPFRHLHEFLIRQTESGTLLALCSKNQEPDVLAVFDQNPGMLLRREHLAAMRVNWNSKPENLRALATQLNLGLDSFVFIDDNPVECAAVRAACPEVTVLQLPTDTTHIPSFLDNIWLFDRAATTTEDRERSQWYQANTQREELQSAAPTLNDFLASLQLRIEVTEPTDDQIARVAQLIVRTNQFNFTSIRRSEAEVRALLESGAKCLVTTVSDRFGDYGLVGAILYTSEGDRCLIDTFLLSCRALGKGVEHRMLSELAYRATREGQSSITLEYHPTDRNEPARAFLEQLRANPISGPTTFTLPSSTLSNLRYTPDDRTSATPPEGRAPARSHSSSPAINRTALAESMQTLGEHLSSIDAVVAAIESAQQSAQSIGNRITPEPLLDASTLEQSLAAIWKKALNRTHIGLNENFFDAGGTSLKAVVVVAMIRKQLHKEVSIVSLFETPTIATLAARLDDSAASKESEAAANAESRGRQRRVKVVKRRVA